MNQFDVVIVGAGPAGITAALLLGEAGLSIALLEKERFPRPKTCGDGITPDIIRQLGLIAPELQQKFTAAAETTSYNKLILTAPNGREVVVPLPGNNGFSSMYACRRIDFDQLLFDHLKQRNKVEIIEGCRITSVDVDQHSVELKTSTGTLTASLVIGADGANSIVARALHLPLIPDSDKAFAVRAYFKDLDYGLGGLSPRVIFHRKLLPGYFWIFPFNDGSANVGLGMTLKEIKKHNLKPEELLMQMTGCKEMQQMFQKAKPEGRLKGHYIPLGRKGRPLSGHRILLAGDAAGLAHPLTAEGIGNAIRSGRLAATHAQNCFLRESFSASFNKAYDKEIYRRTSREFCNFRYMQRLFHYSVVLNLMARLATPRLIGMLTNPDTIAHLQEQKYLPVRLLYLMIKNR
ncbi:MAG TPA: hypothetical protein DEO70_14945 [Bacteroidales bacterium]|nr:MAG: hypothetical protein A2X11_09590 [Bacteroidetes bacterium GWE2_42_24]OFY27913.1 MAG: hypothetical protein A2X09_15270 [Bacteroidetes bacterium GWF2_43_11]PKP25142.1 MAG: hypothetical protein CVU06_04375 [Bacteroidetes bacterium HGW-Bacteroidetes-22]HBZ68127.1 hypothetical protein [Bacteroidales bacterium]